MRGQLEMYSESEETIRHAWDRVQVKVRISYIAYDDDDDDDERMNFNVA